MIESSCFDPNPMVEATIDNNGGFCAAETTFPVSHQFQEHLESNDLKLPTMEDFSVIPSVMSLPNSETQSHMIQQMIQDSNWGVSTDNSNFLMNNTSDPNTTTTTPIPDLLSLLHLPRCSISLQSSNLSDVIAGSCLAYDPLFHLNLPPQPPLIHPNDYSEFLLGIETNNITQRDESDVGNDNNIDSRIIEFSKEIRRKGREKRLNKPFVTERERRCHLNERYDALKLLIPNPSKGDRASILQDGIDYINELRRRVSELKYLVEKKKCAGRHKNNDLMDDHVNEDDGDDANIEKKLENDVISNNNSLRCSWLQRKSKITDVDVRIVDDEVTIKVVQKKKINSLLLVSQVIDQLQLELHHVTGGQIGEHYSFLYNTKIHEESTIYASVIANRVIEVVDQHFMSTFPNNNY